MGASFGQGARPMLKILGPGSVYCDGLTRRSFLQVGGLAFGGGLTLPEILRAEAVAGIEASRRAIIMVVLPGGPPHQDTYDIKEDAPTEIRGEFRSIPTNVMGIRICELMPRVASIMDRLAVIRSLVGALDDHNVHQCITGWETHPQQDDSPRIPGYPKGGWPSIGSVISRIMGPKSPGVPPFISLGTKRDLSMTRASIGQPGYLGAAHAGFEPRGSSHADMQLSGVTLDRLSDRRRLRASLDRLHSEVDARGQMHGVDSFTRQALGILSSGALARAFDISTESESLRRRYLIEGGKAEKGSAKLLEQFLVARRLVQAGVRCVTLNFSRWPLDRESRGGYNWDWHSDNFNKARATLPLLDQGVYALVTDLEEQGLLDEVAVVVWGEFGRTPKINSGRGRDHWPQVASCLLAGGGMKMGQVIGSTTRLGDSAQDRPVHYREVFATLYRTLGIDANNTTLVDSDGRPHYLVDNRPVIQELV